MLGTERPLWPMYMVLDVRQPLHIQPAAPRRLRRLGAGFAPDKPQGAAGTPTFREGRKDSMSESFCPQGPTCGQAGLCAGDHGSAHNVYTETKDAEGGLPQEAPLFPSALHRSMPVRSGRVANPIARLHPSFVIDNDSVGGAPIEVLSYGTAEGTSSRVVLAPDL